MDISKEKRNLEAAPRELVSALDRTNKILDEKTLP